VIRPARPDDVDGIAAVHAAAWQAAYPGIVPASTLQAFTVADRRKHWAGARLDDRAPDRPVFVALDDGAVVGFAVCGPPRDPDMPFDAELYVINVDPGHWRRGVGRRLFARCVEHLSASGRRSFYLWVLTANGRARRFYESLEGRPLADRARDADFDGVGVPEIPYGWEQLPIVAFGDGSR
jgi:ribosomal protein S18 acetylase RimI-like enzyme